MKHSSQTEPVTYIVFAASGTACGVACCPLGASVVKTYSRSPPEKNYCERGLDQCSTDASCVGMTATEKGCQDRTQT